MRAAPLALALLLAATPVLAAPKPPRPPAGPLRSTVYKLPAPLRANAPAWLGGMGKLAFLGNQAAGDPPDLFLWDPKLRQMGRATEGPAVRHSLCAAPDGRLAYVKSIRSEDVAGLFPQAPKIAPGLKLFALHAADGTPIVLTDTRESALANAWSHELEAVSVH